MQRKYIGRVLGVIGLVVLLSSVLTPWIGRGDLAVFKIGLSLVMFGIYLATNLGDVGKDASSRTTFYYGVSAVMTVVLLAVLVFANYIAVKNPKSWDLTKNQIHTLSPDTLKTLEGLKADVKVTAFYAASEGGYAVLDDLFKKYEAKSAHFKYEFVDAIKDPVKTREFNPKSESRVFVKLGATEARVQEPSEEALTNALVKVTHSATKKIYFTTGHGEADPEDSKETGLSEIKKRMENEGLKAEKVNLASTPEIPADAQAIVVAGPEKPFTPAESETVKKYLDAGGKAFLMLEPLVDSGLDELLKAYNVEADKSEVVDPVSRLFGTSEVVPVVQNYSTESEIVRDFHLNTVFPTARPLTVLHQTGVSAVVQEVASSMPSAWGETSPTGQVQHDEKERSGPFPLVVSATLDTKSVADKRSDQARLIVAGDHDFATNKFQSAVGNEDFFLNCLNWLSEQTERITIRPRLRDASRLYLTPEQQATIFFFSIDVLPVTLLVAGLAVWLVRRSK
jgi:ABC-type uncharacterized transport system involved in gliding motility auxiliary subunit